MWYYLSIYSSRYVPLVNSVIGVGLYMKDNYNAFFKEIL